MHLQRDSNLRNGMPNNSFNEIIAKIEMKKIHNLIQNRLARKNTLVDPTTKRIFPLNQVANGRAKIIEVETAHGAKNLGKLSKKLYPNANKFKKDQN